MTFGFHYNWASKDPQASAVIIVGRTIHKLEPNSPKVIKVPAGRFKVEKTIIADWIPAEDPDKE